ncbi:MAG: NAD-dependent epimerase/dehydratase family protein [Chloroflexi bacterium]|nr:NAD-dependent epimerase/dehydratase family protein [Chloroflexota bacterium]
MRCLVTGGAGFLGSYLVERLVATGHDVRIIDSFSSPSSDRVGLLRRIASLTAADIRGAEAVREATSGVEVVFHLAAQSRVDLGDQLPEHTHATNVTGTINVLRAAQWAGARRVVYTSSCEVYGEPATLPVDEQQALQPLNVYGASQVAAEAYCVALGNTDTLSTVILRLSTIIGSGDRDRLIPNWIERARQGLDLEIEGRHRISDFLPVAAAVDALLVAAQPEIPALAINVASGQGTPIVDAAAVIISALESTSRLVVRPRPAHQVERFIADVRRMQEVLHLTPPADPLATLASFTKSLPVF